MIDNDIWIKYILYYILYKITLYHYLGCIVDRVLLLDIDDERFVNHPFWKKTWNPSRFCVCVCVVLLVLYYFLRSLFAIPQTIMISIDLARFVTNASLIGIFTKHASLKLWTRLVIIGLMKRWTSWSITTWTTLFFKCFQGHFRWADRRIDIRRRRRWNQHRSNTQQESTSNDSKPLALTWHYLMTTILVLLVLHCFLILLCLAHKNIRYTLLTQTIPDK